MPVVHIPVTDKHFGYLAQKATERNGKRKKGEKEIRVSDIAAEIFIPILNGVMRDGR